MKSGTAPIAVPLATGCNQQSQQYASPPGIRTATNLRLLQTGALAKRPGALGLAGTTSSSLRKLSIDGTNGYVETPCCVSQVGGSPFVGISSGEAFVMDENQGTLFESCGAFSTAVPIRKRRAFASVVGSATGSDPAAVAVSTAGYVMIATLYGTELLVAIESPAGARIYQLTLSSALSVRCHAVGTKLFVVWQEGAAIKARAYQPNGTNENFTNSATLNTLYDSTYHWDTSSYDGTHWFLLHGTGSDDLQITKYANTTSVTTASFSTAAIAPTPCSIWADSTGGKVWVGYFDDPVSTGSVNYRVYAASDLSLVQGETTLVTGTFYGPPLFGPLRHRTDKSDATNGAFYVHRYAQTGLQSLRAVVVGNAWSDGSTASTGKFTYSVLPISKPDSRQRVWCITDNAAENFAVARIALLRFHDEERDPPAVDLVLPAMIAPGATIGPVNTSMYFHAIATGTSASFVMMPRVLTVLDGTPFVTVEVMEYATAEQAGWRSTARLSPSTVVAGTPVEFYGHSYGKGEYASTGNTSLPNAEGASEVGFLHGPTIVTVALIAGSGGPSGAYVYRAVYEWDDTYGRRHRSEPSAPYEVTLTGTSGARLTIATLDATQRRSEASSQDAIRVIVYRTLAGGTTYQRVFDAGPAVGSGYIDFDDTDPDTDVADEEFIYTDGGVLDNNIAPSCRYLARSEDRLWFGGLFTGNVIQCSKVIIPEEPIQCTDHPSHQVVLPGDCTGLAYMDGQIVAFTRETILLINSSSGPNDQGVGEFAPPRLHTTGIGCVDGRSVLETPEGIFFMSQRGIELLPRGAGTVQFIGAAVRDLVQTSLLDQCGFAAYQADKNGSYARFGLMAGSSEFAIPSVRYVATLDLASGQWFIDDYGTETMGAMGAWPNGFALIRTDLDTDTSPTPIWYEDGSVVSQPLTTGTAYINSSIVMQRFWPFGHTGWGHVRKVMVAFYSNQADWTLSLSVQTDSNTAQSVTWDVTSTGLQWRELLVVNPKCSTVTVTVSDSVLTVNGAKQGPTYLMLSLDAEPFEGMRLMDGNGDRQ